MTRARNQLVSLDATPYYHCISRCVRRAYLCGDDPVSGKNFDHRKVWLVERMKQLAAVFAVDICAYAVMSNHYHLVLHVDRKAAQSWTQQEVIQRWTSLFQQNAAQIETLRKNRSSAAARERYRLTLESWRERLADISWYMRCLNESIARQANREDDCTGRFWEGRFKSQALLDDKALITCMAYVDLNPVRAGISTTPETSDFTSIQERLVEQAKRVKNPSNQQHNLVKHFASYYENKQVLKVKKGRLLPLNRDFVGRVDSSLPFSQRDYQELLQWTTVRIRQRETEAGRNAELPARRVLKNLSIDAGKWLDSVTAFHKYFAQAAGTLESLTWFQEHRAGISRLKHPDKWIRGRGPAQRLFGT